MQLKKYEIKPYIAKNMPDTVWRILKKDSNNKTLLNQLSAIDLNALANCFLLLWSAYVRLLSVKDNSARTFYETEAVQCGWSVRQLDRQISSVFYDQTALSNNKNESFILEKSPIIPILRGLPKVYSILTFMKQSDDTSYAKKE